MKFDRGSVMILRLVPFVLVLSFLIVIVFSAVTLWSLCQPITATDNANLYVVLLNRGMSIRLLQIVNGLVLGFACIYLGVAMCWAGVAGAVELEAKNEQAAMNFKSVNSGAFVVLAGALLLYAAMNGRGIDIKAPTEIKAGVDTPSA